MLGHNGSCVSLVWLVLGAGRTSEPRMNPVATSTAADTGYPGATPCLASHVIDHVMIYILFIVILLPPSLPLAFFVRFLLLLLIQLPLRAPWARGARDGSWLTSPQFRELSCFQEI